MRMIIFLISVFLINACASQYPRPEEGVEQRCIEPTWLDKLSGAAESLTVFSTPYGDIAKGSSMVQVMRVLGNPNKISGLGSDERWHYNFGSGEKLYIYFVNGRVTNVNDTLEDDY
jgi:hypothetical protein